MRCRCVAKNPANDKGVLHYSFIFIEYQEDHKVFTLTSSAFFKIGDTYNLELTKAPAIIEDMEIT